MLVFFSFKCRDATSSLVAIVEVFGTGGNYGLLMQFFLVGKRRGGGQSKAVFRAPTANDFPGKKEKT